MKHIRRLAELALTIITMAALSVGAFAAESCFETGGGTEYYPAQTRVYKSKSGAQDAHEAIRPSSAALYPELVEKDTRNG